MGEVLEESKTRLCLSETDARLFLVRFQRRALFILRQKGKEMGRRTKEKSSDLAQERKVDAKEFRMGNESEKTDVVQKVIAFLVHLGHNVSKIL